MAPSFIPSRQSNLYLTKRQFCFVLFFLNCATNSEIGKKKNKRERKAYAVLKQKGTDINRRKSVSKFKCHFKLYQSVVVAKSINRKNIHSIRYERSCFDIYTVTSRWLIGQSLFLCVVKHRCSRDRCSRCSRGR